MMLSLCIQLLLLSCVCSTYSIEVNITSSPSMTDGFIQTKEGKTVSLQCFAQDTSETEELQWYRNGRLVKLEDGNRLNESHLCIHPTTPEDNGATFTCKLKSNTTMKSSIKLEVNYAPNLIGSEEIEIEEQSDAVLSCNVQANPPVTVSWSKDGMLLDLSSSKYKTSNNGITAQLSINNIKRAVHQGLYSCNATSSTHGQKSKTFNIIVKDKTLKYPVWPTVAGVLVLLITFVLAIVARRKMMLKCFQRICHLRNSSHSQ